LGSAFRTRPELRQEHQPCGGLPLGGWNLSAVTTIYSGRPGTPSANYAQVKDASGNVIANPIRPNAGPSGRPNVGSADIYSGAPGDRNGWYVGCTTAQFNTGKCPTFAPAADNTFGNYPINTVYGPGFYNQDLAVAKSFKATERYRFTLRGEAFNVWNHTNLGDPDWNVTNLTSDGRAGQITGLAPNYQMRRLQFALRLDF